MKEFFVIKYFTWTTYVYPLNQFWYFNHSWFPSLSYRVAIMCFEPFDGVEDIYIYTVLYMDTYCVLCVIYFRNNNRPLKKFRSKYLLGLYKKNLVG